MGSIFTTWQWEKPSTINILLFFSLDLQISFAFIYSQFGFCTFFLVGNIHYITCAVIFVTRLLLFFSPDHGFDVINNTFFRSLVIQRSVNVKQWINMYMFLARHDKYFSFILLIILFSTWWPLPSSLPLSCQRPSNGRICYTLGLTLLMSTYWP